MSDGKALNEKLAIFVPRDEEKQKLFYDGMSWSVEEYNEAIRSAIINLESYPPTKEQEIMLADIKLGDFATLLRNHREVPGRMLASMSKIGNYSDLEKETEGPLFVVYVSHGGRIIHVNMAALRDGNGDSDNYILYWHAEKGWVDLQKEVWPLVIAHLDTPEHYRFAYDLFHDAEGKHKIGYYADNVWAMPTTADSIAPPTYWQDVSDADDDDDGENEEGVDA
jgi:hypothetical protein